MVTITEREPTPGQWSALDRAVRRQNGLVTEERGRGSTRRLPALRRHGWVADGNYVTEAGRSVAEAWEYDTSTGKLRPSMKEVEAAHREHRLLTQMAPGVWTGPTLHDRGCPCLVRATRSDRKA